MKPTQGLNLWGRFLKADDTHFYGAVDSQCRFVEKKLRCAGIPNGRMQNFRESCNKQQPESAAITRPVILSAVDRPSKTCHVFVEHEGSSSARWNVESTFLPLSFGQKDHACMPVAAAFCIACDCGFRAEKAVPTARLSRNAIKNQNVFH
jgi:hypothetical protein